MTLKIEYLEKEIPVYDITVEDNENFYANGILIHNCAEITLSTGRDSHNKKRTAVCCLSSLNLEYYDEWKGNEQFIEDVLRFLDNVLSSFIKKAPEQFKNAIYSALRERSIGLGVMGFHSYLQKKMLPFESPMAKGFNLQVFKWIRSQADKVSKKLAVEKGPCLDSFEVLVKNLFKKKKIKFDYSKHIGRTDDWVLSELINLSAAHLDITTGELEIDKKIILEEIEKKAERFTHKLAIAPTASISSICGNASPGIEPYSENIYIQKNLSGTFSVKNKFLVKLLQEKNQDNSSTWNSIVAREGSVQHLDFLSETEKAVFKTAYEINQAWLIEFASDRQTFIDQAQSLNLFILPGTSKKDFHSLHVAGWKKNIKSFYYVRSKSVGSAQNVSSMNIENNSLITKLVQGEDCLACQ